MKPRRFSAKTVIFSDWQRSQRGKSIYYNVPLAPLTIRRFTQSFHPVVYCIFIYYKQFYLFVNSQIVNRQNTFTTVQYLFTHKVYFCIPL